MNKICRGRALILALFMLVPAMASAVDYYSRSGGTWSGNNRWSTVACNGTSAGNAEPVAGDSATICNGHTITLDVSVGGAGLTFLTIDNGGALEMANSNTARSLTVAGDVTNSGTLNIPTNRDTTSTLSVAGNIINAGTFNFRTDANSLVNTTFTGGGTHTISGGGAMTFNNTTVNNNLIINKTGGDITQTGTITVNGNLTITQGTLNLGNSASITGDTSLDGTLGITSTTGTKSFTGDVTINSSGNWNVTVAEPVTMGKSLTNDGTFTSGTGTYTFSGTAGSVWAGTNNLIFAGAVIVDANRTNNTTTTVTGNLTGSATLTNSGGQRLRLGGTSTITGLTATAANNTVEYFGTVAQTVRTIDYHHLEVNKSTNPATTTAGTVNINGNLTVTAGTLNLAGTTVTLASAGSASISGTLGITSATGAKTFNGDITINIGGTWNHTVNSPVAINANLTNNGTFTANTGASAIYTFGGSSAQTISGTAAGTTTFARLTLNNANGLSLTGSHNVEVTTQLTLTDGRITTNNNVLHVSSTSATSISGAATTRFINGNLRRNYTNGDQSRDFPVGTGTSDYAPVTLALTGGAGTPSLTVSTTAGDHPQLGSSDLNPALGVNRWWTLTSNAGSFTSASAVFGFTAGDLDVGADTNDFHIQRYDGAIWNDVTEGTLTGSSSQATGLTAGTLGQFAIAQLFATPPAVAAFYKMDELYWDGTVNEVLDAGTSAYNGQAASLSSPLPTTDITSPAVAGNPGTCRYGVFDRSKKDYVALPALFPNLTATGATGFTVSAWINTTNNLLPGQRIFIDDQGNTGGWGLSVGETTTAGGVRFYYRAASTVTIDTVPIASNQWLFVALSVNLTTGVNASSATIYVYNSSGSLVTSQSGNFTWAGEVDNGPSSIGGETNASGENTNAFGFSGNIDEVRVFTSQLNSAQIETVRDETRTCPTETYTATVTTAATGGTSISADTAGGTYTSLTGPVISETDFGGMQVGAYTLTAPAGFEFATTVNSVSISIGTVSGSGTNINLGGGPGTTVTVTPTASAITFNVTAVSTLSRFNNLTFSGISLRPISGCPLAASGNIVFATTTPTTITVSNAGTASMVTGTVARIYTVLPGQTAYGASTCGNITGTPNNQTAGLAFNLTRLVATDQSGNIVTTYSGAKTISYSGPGTGGVTPPSYTTNVNFTNGQSTTTLATTLTRAETTSITATDGTLTGIASTSFTVSAGTASRMHVVFPGQSFVSGSGVTGTPDDQVINITFPITSLVATDSFNNLAVLDGSHIITYILNPAAVGSTFTSPVSFTAGVSTTPLLSTITQSGSYTLTASAAGLIVIISSTLNIRSSFICSGWDYHKVITIDHTKVGSGGVTDFPVLISLTTDADLSSKAQASGNDILFTDSTSTLKLAHEIERWNSATGELVVWVKVPAISSSVDTEIIMYYGNSLALAQESPNAVWDSNYVGVWHMKEVGNGTVNEYVNSKANNNHARGGWNGTGVTAGAVPTRTTGKIGYGQNFDGGDLMYGVATGAPNLDSNQTMSFWYQVAANPGARSNLFVLRQTGGGNGTQGGFIGNNDGANCPGFPNNSLGNWVWGGDCLITKANPQPAAATWHHFTFTRSGSTNTLYVDGQQVTTNTATPQNASIGEFLWGTYTPSASPPESFTGQLDETRFSTTARNAAWVLTEYNNQNSPSTFYSLGSEQGSVCVFLDHVRIEHDGLGLTCAPEAVTVKACADSTCSTLYTDSSVTTTLSPTGWVGGNTVSFTGSTTKSLRRNTLGTVSLGSGTTTPAPVNPTRCFIGGTETCSLEFKDSGFIFDIPTQTANKTSSTIKVKAVRKDLTSQSCAPAFTGARSVGFWSTYINPGTGTQQVKVNASNVATSGPAGTPVNLTFDASAEADITVQYPDAGQMQLNARFTGSGAESGLVMEGNDQFVVVPAGICVQTSSVCVAGDHTCAVFAAAGSPFALTVKAVAWEVDGETNAQFCNNTVTPNFRLDDIVLSTQLVAPGGGSNASLGTTDVDIIAANNGSNTNSGQTISEVGVFTVTATPPAYLGETIAASTSANIGRFTPYDFDVSVTSAPVFASSCTAFTYIGQPFDLLTAGQFTVTARAQGGATTQNYTGNFNRITSGTIVFPGGTDMGFREGSGLGLDTGLLGSWAPVIADAGGGLTTLTFDFGVGERITFNRGTPVAPFDAEISLEVDVADTDGIVYGDGAGNDINPAKFGDTGAGQGIAFNSDKEQRWGRMTLANAFGSELLPLTLNLQTEYYLNAVSGFVPNAADSCTVYQGADVDIQDANLSDTLTLADAAVLVPASSTSVTGGAFNPANPLILSNPGNTNLGPGAGKTGALQLTIDLTVLTGSAQDWLQYDWDNLDNLSNGPWDGNPSARATFGVYRGSDDFIYIREPWN